jgi:hypothetical protein
LKLDTEPAKVVQMSTSEQLHERAGK